MRGQRLPEFPGVRGRPRPPGVVCFLPLKPAREAFIMTKLFLGLGLSVLLSLPVLAALKVGDKAPDFSARASLAGKEFNFSLQNALKKGPVVVYFYPSAFTKGCDLEAHTFAEMKDQFDAV